MLPKINAQPRVVIGPPMVGGVVQCQVFTSCCNHEIGKVMITHRKKDHGYLKTGNEPGGIGTICRRNLHKKSKETEARTKAVKVTGSATSWRIKCKVLYFRS